MSEQWDNLYRYKLYVYYEEIKKQFTKSINRLINSISETRQTSELRFKVSYHTGLSEDIKCSHTRF